MPIDPEWLALIDHIWAPIALPLGIGLALAVTGHVLLRKRDVAACIGWIGLAWMTPTWGALLYYFFGVNRVVRRGQRARRHRPPRKQTTSRPDYEVPDHLEPLDRAVHRITHHGADDRNSVEIFHNGDEAYPVMLAAIAAARSSVALSTYIMRNDATGLRFVEALAQARKRGVEVRVLLDGIGSGYFPRIARRMRRDSIPVALFMHSALPWRMPFLNLRSHKKILVVDGSTGFTGGMNISSLNLLASHPRFPVADTHFRVQGPVVAQLMSVFAQDWAFTTGEDLADLWFPDLADHGSAVARVITSGPDQDLEKIQSVLLEAIACAQHSIKLMTPYFLPSEVLVTALGLASVRGVRVDVIVPRRSDHRFVDLAMRAHIGPLLERGVRMWFGPQPFNHSKLIVIDKEWCMVGSANWDMRSLRLNFEMNVEVYSKTLAETLETFMTSQQEARLRMRDLTARNLPVRLRDAALRLLLPYI